MTSWWTGSRMRDRIFPDGRVVLVMESCFSGRYSEGELVQGVSASPFGGDPQPLKEVAAEKGIVTISAASSDQTAYWDEEIGNSVFTRYLADGLFGQADCEQDGRITFGELEAYLRDRVPARAAMIQPSARQTPEISEADPNAVLVQFPDGYRPSSRKLDRARQQEARRAKALLAGDVSAMTIPQLRETLAEADRQLSACAADCMALLTFQQTVEKRLFACEDERALYRDLAAAGDLDDLGRELGTSVCGEVKAAAGACVSSGSADSAACACLGEEVCAVQAAATPEDPEPVAAPAPAQAADLCADARAHFELARDINSVDALQGHLDFYGACPYAPLAKAMIAKLTAPQPEARDEAAAPADPRIDPAVEPGPQEKAVAAVRPDQHASEPDLRDVRVLRRLATAPFGLELVTRGGALFVERIDSSSPFADIFYEGARIDRVGDMKVESPEEFLQAYLRYRDRNSKRFGFTVDGKYKTSKFSLPTQELPRLHAGRCPWTEAGEMLSDISALPGIYYSDNPAAYATFLLLYPDSEKRMEVQKRLIASLRG